MPPSHCAPYARRADSVSEGRSSTFGLLLVTHATVFSRCSTSGGAEIDNVFVHAIALLNRT
jgi:hypothetical protein